MYLLCLYNVLEGEVKGTGPYNFSTTVPFGGPDFCVIDSTVVSR